MHESVTPPPAQQKSEAFAVQALSGLLQVEGTQRPWLAPEAVLQMSPEPYVGSDWHWESELHVPQVFGVVTPQIWPTVQLASLWQLPGTQLPAVSQMYGLLAPP